MPQSLQQQLFAAGTGMAKMNTIHLQKEMELHPAVYVQCKLQHDLKEKKKQIQPTTLNQYLKILPSSKEHFPVSYLANHHMLAISILPRSHSKKPKENFCEPQI